MNISKLLFAILIFSSGSDLMAKNYCGDLINATGPFDYREKKENDEVIKTVEGRHFTEQHERLIEDGRAHIGGELAYTLRVFPNHHRALMAMGKLALREKTLHPSGAGYSIECFFERGMRFRPDDGIVHLVYGIYLAQSGDLKKAMDQMIEADRLEPNNSNINYNIGILHFKQKNYEKSIYYAKNAYRLGFSLPGLKDMLIKSGKWDGLND